MQEIAAVADTVIVTGGGRRRTGVESSSGSRDSERSRVRPDLMLSSTTPSDSDAEAHTAAGATAAGVARAALLRQLRNIGRRIWRNPSRMFAPSVPPLKIVQERARKRSHTNDSARPGLRSVIRELWAQGVRINTIFLCFRIISSLAPVVQVFFLP